jgi:hypothetical protein
MRRCRKKVHSSGPFHQQLAMVQRTILRLSLRGGKQQPKPGPYNGPMVRGKGERQALKLTYTYS